MFLLSRLFSKFLPCSPFGWCQKHPEVQSLSSSNCSMKSRVLIRRFNLFLPELVYYVKEEWGLNPRSLWQIDAFMLQAPVWWGQGITNAGHASNCNSKRKEHNYRVAYQINNKDKSTLAFIKLFKRTHFSLYQKPGKTGTFTNILQIGTQKLIEHHKLICSRL